MAENISPSKKEIYTKLLDIAGNYTDIENGDFLKTGLFGYITESMAMMMRDSTFHKTMLYNESSLNTAMIPKTVYNWAKMFNIEVQKATPAYADIEIIIPVESLLTVMANKELTTADQERYGLKTADVSNGNFIILDKEDPILAGDYYFSLEHSILLKNKVSNGSPGYSAEYILTEYDSTNYQTINSKRLNVRSSMQDDTKNIIITARAYQYKRTVFNRQITSNSFLNKVQRFEFEDQFCGAKLFYIENGKNVEVELSYSDMNSGENTAFYNLSNENELEIKFKTGDNYFSPAQNTTLKVFIYTTKGENVPSTFNGDALMLFSKNDMKSLPMVINFNPTSILEGKNTPTLQNIKETIVNEISTRNTITTKSDLDAFFKVIMKLVRDLNDGRIKFIKKRDDVLKRTYNAYLLVRDMIDDSNSSGNLSSGSISACVPTNTIDVVLNPANSINQTDTNNNFYKFKYPKFIQGINDNKVIYTYSSTTENYNYFSPFIILISTSPVTYVKYLYDLVNNTDNLLYSENSEVSQFESKGYYLEPISISFKKSANDIFSSNAYNLVLKFKSNVELNKNNLTGNIKIKENEFSISDITSESIDTNTYNISIKVNFSGNLSINNKTGVVSLELSNNSKNITFSSKEKLTVDLSGLNYSASNLEGQNSLSVQVYTSESNITFFYELDDIMESSIVISKDNNNTLYSVKDVPVISSDFKISNYNGFTKQLFTYIDKLKEYNSKLETSTFFSLKFYNTSGISYLYDTMKTNIDLDLIITLTEDNEALKTEIRSYIRKAIDKMNDNEQISVSNLISLLLNSNTYGKYISYIEFVGLNGTFNQTILKRDISEKEEEQYTPEWINLKNLNDIQFVIK